MVYRTAIRNPKLAKRISLEEAKTVFMNNCRIKDRPPHTIEYYREDIDCFFGKLKGINYIDEISRDVFKQFVVGQLDEGKKVTSLNTRVRGLRVFLKFCAEREYMEPFSIKLVKEDDTVTHFSLPFSKRAARLQAA